jgi:hypothetical protein
MYKLIPWSDDLNLAEFYDKAKNKGFDNNSSQKMLVDSFSNEFEKEIWIFYYNDKPVGSVAAHSFDVLGSKSYRICARTCLFTDELPITSLRTLTGITTHQNIVAQFFIPKCIEWAPHNADLYITSNESKTGSQRLVHKIFCPALEKKGILTYQKNIDYRGINQSVWKLNTEKFIEDLKRYKRWLLDV